MRTISNGDNIIDSRDVIQRITELETQLPSMLGCDIPTSEVDFDLENEAHTDNEEEIRELWALRALEEGAEGYASDWRHGVTLIRDSYFEDYARQLAEDIGAISGKESWPLDYIDWERAAEALKQDYTSADFNGVTYWAQM